MPHTVIIGAGQAGATVALTLRQLGRTSPITLIGDECWPPYERPPLSKGLLQGRLDIEKTFLRPADFYTEQGIDRIADCHVRAIDRAGQCIELDARVPMHYDQLVIATGARIRPLSIAGERISALIHPLRSIDDALKLRTALIPEAHLLVIGGGFIGLEIAASARTLGVSVTLLEQAPTLMGRVLPPAIANHLAALHIQQGVTLQTNVNLLGLDAHPNGNSVTAKTSIGSITADAVAFGIGSIPNTDLAETAGLHVNDGIVVDEYGRTSDPHIWAVGDVTRHFNPLLGRHVRLESWKNAQNQAIAVAKSIAGQPVPYAELPWLWTDQYDLNLQLAGMPLGDETLIWRGTPEAGRFTVFGLHGQTPIFAITVNQGREMRFAQQLIMRGTPVDLEQLADTQTPLQSLAV